jgi:hypothetical protein
MAFPDLLNSSLLFLAFVSRNTSVVVRMVYIVSEFPHPLHMFPEGADKFRCPVLCLESLPLVCIMGFNELDPLLGDPSFREVLTSYL